MEFCPQWIENFGKMLFMGEGNDLHIFGVRFCVCLCPTGISLSPKVLKFFYFDNLKEASQPHLSESLFGFSLLKYDLYFRERVKKKNQCSPNKINLLVWV